VKDRGAASAQRRRFAGPLLHVLLIGLRARASSRASISVIDLVIPPFID
jgi:hypothetical protein